MGDVPRNALLANAVAGYPAGRALRYGYDETTAPEGMRGVYEMLAPKPGTQYGDLLPVARDADGSLRPAMPNMMREGLLGIADLLSGVDTGEVTGRGANSITMGGLGTGMAMAPRGAMAVGGAPIKAYHGSPHSFDRFDLSKAGSTTDAGSLGRAVYSSTDARVAEGRPHRYELNVTPKNPLEISLPDFRTDKSAVVREALGLPKTATAEEVAAEAQRRGFDATVLDYSPTGYSAQEIAAYDPAIVEILRKYGLSVPAPVAPPLPNGMRPPNEREY